MTPGGRAIAGIYALDTRIEIVAQDDVAQGFGLGSKEFEGPIRQVNEYQLHDTRVRVLYQIHDVGRSQRVTRGDDTLLPLAMLRWPCPVISCFAIIPP